jgi:hypothetical protein
MRNEYRITFLCLMVVVFICIPAPTAQALQPCSLGGDENGDDIVDTDCDNIADREDQCYKDAGPAANNGCPITPSPPTELPPPPPTVPGSNTDSSASVDSDQDGVPDVNDQCPGYGPNLFSGCPFDPFLTPTPGGTSSSVPLLFDTSSEVCLIATRTSARVNIRERASTSARRVGYLLPQDVLPALDKVSTSQGIWYKIETGWVASWVTRQSTGCLNFSPDQSNSS